MIYNEEKINNTLTAGVCPDGLKDSIGIKLLICFLINNFDEPLSQNDITEIIFERSLANYFETCAAFEELFENGFIAKEENSEILSVTQLGKTVAETLYNDIPLSVREKAVDAIKKRISRALHEKETRVDITEIDNGCRVDCVLLGDKSELMSISLYLPDADYAAKAKERFIDDPEFLYRTILAHLTGESSLAPESE